MFCFCFFAHSFCAMTSRITILLNANVACCNITCIRQDDCNIIQVDIDDVTKRGVIVRICNQYLTMMETYRYVPTIYIVDQLMEPPMLQWPIEMSIVQMHMKTYYVSFELYILRHINIQLDTHWPCNIWNYGIFYVCNVLCFVAKIPNAIVLTRSCLHIWLGIIACTQLNIVKLWQGELKMTIKENKEKWNGNRRESKWHCKI